MYKLTLVLFAFFSLVLPIFAVPVPVPVGLVKRNTGRGTFYTPGLGNCGTTNYASQLVVAVSTQIYDNGAHCGKSVQINYDGKSVMAKVVDSCPGCGKDDLDMSSTAFGKLAPTSKGVIEINWEFV
jgi:hypothetical protein